MAGLTAASALQQAGWKVKVVDKGRGVGGRMATRRIDQVRFDHGAQFFTARDARFQERVLDWEKAGVVTLWYTNGSGLARYRGVEGMSAIPKYMARELDVDTSARITNIDCVDGRWAAQDESGTNYESDVLILTPPPEQSLALCEPFRPLLGRRLVQALQGIHFDPCYSLMVLTEGPSNVPHPGYERPQSPVLLSIADNTQKGITDGGSSALTLHATARFTIEHWDDEPAAVAALMTEAASQYIGAPVVTWQLHRWRYSHPVHPEDSPFLMSRCPAPVYFAGDGFGGPRVEGAFLSGLEAAEHLIASESELPA